LKTISVIYDNLATFPLPLPSGDLDSIPPDIDLYLSCSDIKIGSLRELTDINNLKGLSVFCSRSAKCLWRYTGRMENLKILSLQIPSTRENRIRHLSTLDSLQILELAGIKLSNQGLRQISNLENLKVLSLSSYQPDKPACFLIWLWDCLIHYPLDVLKYLPYQLGSILKPSITTKGWRQLNGLSNLRELTLYGARLSDEDMKGLGTLHNLRILNLSQSTIRSKDLALLENLHNLRVLRLPDCTGSGEIFNLTGLRQALPYCTIIQEGIVEVKIGKPVD
jgi:Leucine-rich repeat (LRR) protein